MTGTMTKSLNGKQAKALAALLCSPTLAAASKVSGVSEKSIYRYLRMPDFADAYAQARAEQIQLAVCQLERIAAQAVLVLEEVMMNTWQKGSARIAAARTTLSLVLRGCDDDEENPLMAQPQPEPKRFDLARLSDAEFEQYEFLRYKMCTDGSIPAPVTFTKYCDFSKPTQVPVPITETKGDTP